MKPTKVLVVAGICTLLLGAAPAMAALDAPASEPAVQAAEAIAESVDTAVDRALTMMTAILESSPQEAGASRSLSLFSQSEPFPIYGLEDAPLKLNREQRELLAQERRLYFYVSGTKPSLMLVVQDARHRTAMIQIPVSALAQLIARQEDPELQALLAVKGQPIGASALTVDEQVAVSSLAGSEVRSQRINGVPLAFAPTRIMGVGILVRQGPAPAVAPDPRALPEASRRSPWPIGGRRLPLLLALGLGGAFVGTLSVRWLRRRNKRYDASIPQLDLMAGQHLSSQAERSFADLKRPLNSALTRLDALIDRSGLRSTKTLQDAVTLTDSLTVRTRQLREEMRALKDDHSSPRLAILKAALDVALVAMRDEQRDPSLQHAATKLRELADPLEDFLALEESFSDLQTGFEGLAADVDKLAQGADTLQRAEQVLETTSAQASQLIQMARHLRQKFARLGSSMPRSGDFRIELSALGQHLGPEIVKLQRLTNENRNGVGEVAVILDGCQGLFSAGATSVSGAGERTGRLSEQLGTLHVTIKAWDAEPVGEVILVLGRAMQLLGTETPSDEGLRENLVSVIQLLRNVQEFRIQSMRELQSLAADGKRLARLLSTTVRKSHEMAPSCEEVYADLGRGKTHLQAARSALNQLQATLNQSGWQLGAQNQPTGSNVGASS